MLKILCTLFLTMISAGAMLGWPPDHANPPFLNENKTNYLTNWNPGQQLVVDAALIFVSSNTSSQIGVFSIDNGIAIAMEDNIMGVAADADGIYYDRNRDVLFQLNRTDNVIDIYGSVCTAPTPIGKSTSGVRNGREIAVIGNKLVAAQDANDANGQQNKLVVFNISPSSALSFDKAFIVDINLWGIHASGTTLYAVVDNSNKLAVFNNFFSQSAGLLNPSTIVAIEGLVRTHGITYDAATDMMFLTDIGDAASDSDGAIVVIPDFTTASADGMVSMSEQIRGSGMASRLGNPVDIAYDNARERIYVAERANGGGQVLAFNLPMNSGNLAAVYHKDFPGASAIFFSDINDMPDDCALIDGGSVMMEGGATETTIVIDGNPDVITFASDINADEIGFSFTYVITDADGKILGIPAGNMQDFDPAGVGACLVYGLSYTGNLNISPGDNLLADDLAISDDCFDLSDNWITVNRVAPSNTVGQFFVSSNTQAVIGVYDILTDASIIDRTIPSMASDADGIYYDRSNDALYQLNRTANVINAYSNVSTAPTLTATSTSDFTNGREIAIVGDKLVVTQDADASNGMQDRLLIYTISPMSITLDKTFDVDINLWGIHANLQTLYAVVDNSNNVAIFNDFFSQPAGPLTPDAVVAVEGLVRTHGITYDAVGDMMLLTDIGDAASATDGALVAIRNFTMASADNLVSLSEQARVFGGASQLGNPVDIALDKERSRVYVAERANGGGKVLGFKLPNLSGGIAPVYSQLFAGASAIHFSDADDMPDACVLAVDGGTVQLPDGNTSTTIVIDGTADMISFDSISAPILPGASFTYVITDATGSILGIPPGDTQDFDPAGVGTCYVYGLSYTGTLNIAMGDNLLTDGLVISDDCAELSSNRITVNRVADQATVGQFFVSSNTQPVIGVFDILQDASIIPSTISSVANDADGIYYDQEKDVLYQLNRTDNVINAYSNVSTTPTLTATSTSNFTNGREIAVVSNKLVVAQDASDANGQKNRLVVYTISPTMITFDKAYDVSINLWGIHLDFQTLYAVVDNSNTVAVFHNLFSKQSGAITPDAIVSVEGLVRTHGITYDADSDLMLLTDIGDAASATDGALVVIANFMTASADGMISSSEQVRVKGGGSRLGNPVDVAVDKSRSRVYVAERANGGGRVLGFKLPIRSGGIAPVYNRLFAGASAINFARTVTVPEGCEMVDGGNLTLAMGGTQTTIVVDGNPDVISFVSDVDADAGGFSFTYVITDVNGIILRISTDDMADFDPAGIGNCFVYGLSYTGNLLISPGDDLFQSGLMISDECFDLSNNWLSVNRVDNNCDYVIGGTVMLDGGGTETTIVIDGIADMVAFSSSIDPMAGGFSFTYVITDSDGNILRITTDNVVDFDPAGVGSCLIYGLSYTGNLNIEAGDDLLMEGLEISDACYDLSDNWLTVYRIEKCDAVDAGTVMLEIGGTETTVVIDGEPDILTFTSDADPMVVDFTFTYVVTDATGVILAIPDGNMVDFDPAGVGACLVYGLAYTGNLLIAPGDNLLAADLMISDDCFDLSDNWLTINRVPDNCDFVYGGTVSLPDGNTTTTIIIDGNPDLITFASDVNPVVGGFSFTYVVTDAMGTILGIPPGNMVDFDPAGVGSCYVYGLSYTGNLNIAMGDNLQAPGLAISDDCFKLSSNRITVKRVPAQNTVGQFFVSSNTQMLIGVYDILQDASIVSSTIPSVAADADGIFYDRTNDVLYQLNRTDNVINAYSNVSTAPTLTATSTSDFTNGREIAVVGNKLVVTQDASDANGMQNRFVIYTISPTAITLDKAYDVDINLWGIHANLQTLYAVVDNSNNVAVFNNFFNQPAGPLTPDAVVAIEGLVRTHGITYDAIGDMLLLTDVGDAASATDGALVVIRNFATASADNMVSLGEQARVFGGASFLGNPVDIALDKERSKVYVAERANGGGRVLGFNLPALSGGIAPIYNHLFGGASAIFFSDTDDMPDACALIDGGTVMIEGGGTSATVVIDSNADLISFASDVDAMAGGFSFTYVVTDAAGMILGIPPGNMVDFEPAGVGNCYVYGLSYSGNLNIAAGDDLFLEGLLLSDDCFELSSNRIIVNRVLAQEPLGQLFTSSNTQPLIGVYNILDNNVLISSTIPSEAMDADGIFYDRPNDILYQLNRTDNVINVYSNVSTAPTLSATSTSDFTNGREIAVSGDKLVVTQDADDANGNQNRLVVYTISPMGITLDKVFDVAINLWGIHADDQTLYAVVDNSNNVAIFEDFFSQPAGMLTPDATIAIEGLVRTHGITYDAVGDMMLLTDIGDAASATDGALVVVRNFATASADGMVMLSEQVRVFGGASQLGNPVDIALDKERSRVYVAERANGGGKVLGFKLPNLSGGIAPVYSQLFAGASAIHFSDADEEMMALAPEAEQLITSDPTALSTAQIQSNVGLAAQLTVKNTYPVPAIDRLHVSLTSSIEQEATIAIFNTAGKLMIQKRIDLYTGDNLTDFDVSDWASGMYFLRIPSLNITSKFIKAGQ